MNRKIAAKTIAEEQQIIWYFCIKGLKNKGSYLITIILQ